MAEQNLNVGIDATSNFPTVVQKVVRSISSLQNNLDDLVGVLQDLSKFTTQAESSLGGIGKSAKNASKDITTSANVLDELRGALQLVGREGDEALKKLDFTKIDLTSLSSAEIEQFSQKLKEVGTNLGEFLTTGEIDLGFRSAIEQLNELQKLTGDPLSVAADFSSSEEAFAELRRLNDGLRSDIKETYEALTDDSVGRRLAKQFEPIEQLKKSINDIQGGSSSSPLKGLFNFEEIRGEAEGLITSVEQMENRLREIGPAARQGNGEAVQEFVQLRGEISRAEQSAESLQQQLRDAQTQFSNATSGQNTSLGALGFRQIKLNDIFPTAEQQKIVQIQSRIDQAVRDSVQEGAVKRTLNFFLAQDRQIESVDRNVVSLTSHLPRLRYALYDVSNTATIFGTAIVGAITATVKFAADYERAFADVIRTTGIAGGEIGKLRREMIELSKSIPVSFSDLADIATLAGQLNIANDVVAEFTETVAQFSATTDVSIESAATAFGRLDQLVDGVNGQFIKLGSSILAVGINAVATESDIIAISTQIASVANIAGFSASELIGFSSALASVGTRPELARGTFTRLFTEIQQAVAESGEQLDLFARTAGQSSEEFASAWGAGAGADQVVAVLRGLEAAGKDADGVLRELGITSVRDVPTLLKLAQSVEEVERQIAIANLGFDEGTELQDQYGIITATLSEKLEILKNNFSAVLAALGSISGPLTFAVDLLAKFLGVVESILQTPLGGAIAGIAALFGTLVGVTALVTGALARFGASTAGAATAMIELFEVTAFTKIQVDSLGASTNNARVQQLKQIAASKGQVAQQKAQAVAFARSSAAMNQSSVSTLRKNASLTVLQARLASVSAGFTAYTARVRASGAAALAAAQQTKLYGAAVTTLKGIKGVAVFLAISFAVEKLFEQMEKLNGETKTAEERFENWGQILEAVRQDSRDFANATEENIDQFTVLGSSVQGAGEEVSNYSRVVAAAGDNEDDLARVLGNSTDAFDAQTIAIGRNTRALLAQQIAKELAAASETPGLLDSIQQAIPFVLSGTFDEFALNRIQAGGLDALISTLGTDLSNALSESGFDFGEWTRLVAEGSTEAANELANNLEPAARAVLQELQESGRGSAEEMETLAKIITGDTAAALGRFVESGSEVEKLLAQTRIELAVTGALFQDFEEGVDGAEVATDSFKDTLNDIVDAYFAPINAQREMEESIRSLGEVFFNEGAQIAVTSEEMQEAISAVIATASSPEEAVDALGGFFRSIVDGGYASEEQLGILQSVIVDTYRTAVAAQMESLKQAEDAIEATIALRRISDRGGLLPAQEEGVRLSEKALAENREQQAALNDSLQIIQNINKANGNAAESAGLLARGYNDARVEAQGAANSAKDIADETEEAAEEVRTLLDYASDLESVFSRAFDLRFARGSVIDELAESWENFGEQVFNAQNSLEELQATQQDLAADRAIKEYFLSVAEAYDDQLRAAQLRNEISELDRDQAEAARELAEAQETAAGANALTGQTRQARQNRSALLGLVSNYQDYITVLAESGASQDELREATERARREFIEQARELGFAEEEVMMYAEAFDDVRTAIDRVPRDITIDFNADPALQALNELNAKLDASIERAKELNRVSGAGDRGNGGNVVIDDTPTISGVTEETLRNQVTAYDARINTLNSSLSNVNRGALGGADLARTLEKERQAIIDAKRWTLRAAAEFQTGGFTGRGPRMEPAGIVHRGEYVIPKQFVNQSSGMPDPSFLAQLQNGMRGYQMGGFVGGPMAGGDGSVMVELSPYDRKLLENAGNVQLRLNGRVVAEATNQNNFNQARRGSD